ncbi:NAD-dependent malic enzyme [Novosphingobium sp. FSW06-99]|uniref:NAD-dependent malic enzyme n=1 Tax=Novosphingobium sp. FSW06-99 TaxID=1739113 RepID=UPI00076D765D|nr:NAD-dependent malic enzyme [Novosphingobium sp. FSW06-99]KUR80836.1 malate dehydrogenase [Novosphingobium sp. FSW06-99]
MTTDFVGARALLNDPLTNRGTAFTLEERDAYGLHGLLPSHVFKLEDQIERRVQMLEGMDSDFHRYAFLRELQDTNEVLFHAVVQSDLPRMLPLVYTPTVGEGCQRFSQIFRRPRGLFLSWPNRHRIRQILADPSLDRVKVIVVSDGERILGLGDQGAGGMGIPIGKLALYTACAGFHPAEVLPILLDCGTDNPNRLNDPLYIGWHSPRVRGADYDAFVEEFVSAVDERWPGVLLQWEDFAGKNAYDLLARYRQRLLTFNDDIQGTAATAVGTLLAAVRVTGVPLSAHRVVLYGVGAAGSGIAEMLVRAIMAEGVDEATARRTIWPIDRDGLIVADMADLGPQQVALARDPADVAGWTRVGNGRIGLEQTIAQVRPSVLIGASGQKDAFNEGAVRLMASLCEKPVVFPLSNPVSRAEATPADILRWSDGRAIVGTGSPFGTPGVTQVNNVYVFPGVGLGALAAKAEIVTDGMFMAAARRLGELSAEIGDGGPGLLPPITALREVALRIAIVVAQQALAEGVAGVPAEAITRDAIAAQMWEPAYD